MQLEKEKETREAAERCRLLAQRIAEELAPEAAAVLAADEESGALLEKALRRAGIRANPWTAAATAQPELLVVEDPAWVELPARLAEQVLLVCTDATALSAWAEKLAERGYYRDLQWRSRGRVQQAALFCTVQPSAMGMVRGYEEELDILRDRMVRAERTCGEEATLIERLRSDLSLSRSHEKQLEQTLNEVTGSTFWKMTWPARYAVSKSRQLWHTFPLFVFLHELRTEGVSGMLSQAFDKFMADLCEAQGVALRDCLANSFCLSADVTAAYDPNFADVYDKRNAAFVNYGVGLCKYTGAGGKSGASDASAEVVGRVRKLLNDNGVFWQMAELGKTDAGGGGTVAKFMAQRNIDTLDAGVPVLSMHAPYETVAKLDCYMTYKTMRVIFEQN